MYYVIYTAINLPNISSVENHIADHLIKSHDALGLVCAYLKVNLKIDIALF
jgi:hypothetical protein